MSTETTLSNVEVLTVSPEHKEMMRQECRDACRRIDEEFIAMMNEYNTRIGVSAFSLDN